MKTIERSNVDEQANRLPKLSYTLREAAQIIGVSYHTAWNLVQLGHLRPFAPLRIKLFSRRELERFVAGKGRRRSLPQ